MRVDQRAVTNSRFIVLDHWTCFADSSLFFGYGANNQADPRQGGTFESRPGIDSFRAKGTDGSIVATDRIVTATIGNVTTNNGGKSFELMAHTKFGAPIVTQPRIKLLQ